jgi:uncharacterized protein
MMSGQARTISAADLPANPFERGIYLSAGRGGQVDLIEAHKWFNIAAAHGDRAAAQRRDELAGEMSREEVATALRAAREWITRH